VLHTGDEPVLVLTGDVVLNRAPLDKPFDLFTSLASITLPDP
jgi:hypothetical protein